MGDDVFSTVNNALGLFNNIDRLREQSTLKERGDAIAKSLADNGGDFHALDPKLYSDRAGMAALASHVNTWSQTEQGKQTILQNQIKDAQYQTRLLGQYGSEIDKAMQTGNTDLATSLACSFSKAIRSPHSVSKSKEPGMLDIIFASPDGEQKTGTMSLNDFLSMMKGYQQNSPEWNKYLLLNGLALNEINNSKRESFDEDYVSVGKDGKEISLIPQVDYNEKKEIERLFFLPGTGNLSEAQLSQMGFSKPMKATDARKEKMDNRRLDMEDRRLGLYAASISARGGLGGKGRPPKASDLNAFNRMVDATLAQMGYGKTSKGYAKMNEYGEPIPVSLDDTDFADALSFAREQVAASFQQNLGIHFGTAVQSGQSQDGAANPQSGNTSWKNFR